MNEHDAVTPGNTGARWNPGLKWFLAELLVVVVGILVALLLQAAWQRHSDRQEEAAYLRQISADLRETTISMVMADSAMRPAERAGGLIIQAYQMPTAPPSDSIFKWLRDLRQTNTRRPMLGTVQALLSTGDLRLIRDDSLRGAIVKYYDQALGSISITEDMFRASTEAYAALNELVDYSELSAEYTRITGADERVARSGPAPFSDEFIFVAPGDRISRFKRPATELLADRKLAGLLATIQLSKRNHSIQRRTQKNLAINLRKRIERELGNDTLQVLRDSVSR